MNKVFEDFLRKFVLVFFDDILIYSHTTQAHWRHLELIFERLREIQLFVKRNKCRFGVSSVNYLGHVISSQGVSADPGKLESIIGWPTPRTVKELRGFLGLIDYCRKFVRGYGLIAQPLTSLLKKDAFFWSEDATQAFEKLKAAMSSPPILAMPDFSKPFVIETYASGTTVGAFLMQDDHPIAFLSHALKGKRLVWLTYEKEMFAIILAVAKWRPYLLGSRFLIRTDHISLKHMIEQRIHMVAQQKWLLKLLGYDFAIEYKVGASNKVVDALSRKEEKTEILSCAMTVLVPSWLETVKAMYASCDDLKLLKEKWERGRLNPVKYQEKNGLLFKKGRIIISSQHEF